MSIKCGLFIWRRGKQVKSRDFYNSRQFFFLVSIPMSKPLKGEKMQRTHKFRANKLNKEKHWQKGDFGRRIHATKSNQFVISSCANPLKAPDIFDSDLKLLQSVCVCEVC